MSTISLVKLRVVRKDDDAVTAGERGNGRSGGDLRQNRPIGSDSDGISRLGVKIAWKKNRAKKTRRKSHIRLAAAAAS